MYNLIMQYSIRSPKNKIEFKLYYNFRWEMLRKPMKLSTKSSKDKYENNSFHLMAIKDDKEIIGCGRVHLNKNKENQIRFMAVKANFQRKGVGSKILVHLEKYISTNKGGVITLNAREGAVNFYLSLGYIKKERHNSETLIPHIRMVKNLS